MRALRGVGLAFLLVTLGACGGDEDSSTASTAGDEVEDTSADVVGTISESQCSDGASCAAAFTLDGELFALSCGAVRPDAVTDSVAGRGEVNGASIEARRISEVDERVALAVNRPGGGCAEGQDPTSEWSFAFADAAEPSATDAAICAAGVAPELTSEC